MDSIVISIFQVETGLRDITQLINLVDLFLKPSDLLLVQLGFEPRSLLPYYCTKISVFIRVNF